MSQQIRTPINLSKILPDVAFRPLNGQLYVGQPNKDPRQYPLANTEAGVAIVNGVLPEVFVANDFVSILVLDDHDGRQVFYVPRISTQIICEQDNFPPISILRPMT